MATVTSRTFRSGNSEALRLPKEVSYGSGVEVIIERTGDVLTVRPKRLTMAELMRQLDALPAPDSVEVRDPDIFPDREGL
jgi:antitoxin VapB